MGKESPSRVVALGGKLFVDQAGTLHSLLTQALAESASVSLNWDAVEDIDLSVLQLLYAARREAVQRGKELRFTGVVSDRVSKRLVASGFLRVSVISGEEFESGLVDF